MLVSSALACKPPPPPPPPPPPAAAVVDGVPILLSRLQREFTRTRRGTDPLPQEALVTQGRALLDPLIEQKLLLARAKAENLLVAEPEVQRELDELKESARTGGPSFNERLAADGLTAEELTDEIRERLTAEHWLAAQVKIARPTPQELKAAYDKAQRSHDPSLLFEVPEEVRCAQIMVSSAPEAKAVLDQARKGASFEELARQHSQSPDARDGGDLGFYPRGTMPPPFDDCFALQKNQLSGVLRSRYGYHVLKQLDKRPGRHKNLADATPELEHRLLAEARLSAERAVVDELRKKAVVTIDDAVIARLVQPDRAPPAKAESP
ncbi:MAG: peptidylprolyl isomerase [Deltaproteobacteria bacterium]|nr:peptidylprolyl isomerase [Deltaproteobacteria bacterium]